VLVSDARVAAVVVLAAGEGTRMKSSVPKVLHTVGGRSLLAHLLAAAAPLSAEHLAVVVGHRRDDVTEALTGSGAVPVVQDEQRGTGHAVRLALEELGDIDGTVVVLPGDTPLLTTDTLRRLVEGHQQAGAAATMLTARVPDPTGYGRVLRDDTGAVRRVVEHRDATEAELAVDEINTSVWAFEAAPLRAALAGLSSDNAQGEEYLPDVIPALLAEGRRVAGVLTDAAETAGVNDRVQLADAGRELRDRTLVAWMRAGVTVIDPASTWVDVDVVLSRDVVLHPGVQLHGATQVAEGAEIGPDCTLRDTIVGAGASVVRTHSDRAEIGELATVGPFAYLRPGARLAGGVHVGTYVEIKNADVGEGSKVPHLTYVGDATIGRGVNIGASSVFVNYDGVTKRRSEVGDQARTGADNTFVAPVRIGAGAYTGAGAVIREDVPPGALAVSAGPQRTISGWTERKRPDTPPAEAARQAGAETGDNEQERPDTDGSSTDDGADR
jgi:bifunctional UDP-N-acetylglucosamine pyrophosphorylase/glucosamine-1-phosphate N-acetyltransferase